MTRGPNATRHTSPNKVRRRVFRDHISLFGLCAEFKSEFGTMAPASEGSDRGYVGLNN